MRSPSVIVLGAVLGAAIFAAPRTASADITAFLGASPTGATRMARGLAFGGGFLVVGFEFEYSDLVEDLDEAAPGLRSGMFNGLVQTPVAVAGLQFYGTAGGGVYREELGVASETNVGVNLGGGVKVRLIGPLRARLDYRLFKLRGSAIHDRYHRFYLGANLGF